MHIAPAAVRFCKHLSEFSQVSVKNINNIVFQQTL